MAPRLEECNVSPDCPIGYTQQALRLVAKACGVRVCRSKPEVGYKTMPQLCQDIQARVREAPAAKAKSKATTEQFGQTVEYLLAHEAGVSCTIAKKRIQEPLLKDTALQEQIRSALAQLPRIERHIGDDNTDVDFVLEGNQTLSVKTNTSASKMVCPQTIGQATRQRFLHYFGHLYRYGHHSDASMKLPPSDTDKIKWIILKHAGHLLHQYLQSTFKCDYLLWIVRKPGGTPSYETRIFPRALVLHTILPSRDLSFSKSNSAAWKESNTVYYDGIPIGSFQIHCNRNAVKFRFHFTNLLRVLAAKGKAVRVATPKAPTTRKHKTV
jgi:hypothetical protein